jgi:hypothetical protein
MRVKFKPEEKDFLFRKYRNEGYNTWDASNKVNLVQNFLINFANDLKNKYNRKFEKMQKELMDKKVKSFDIIKVKSNLELEMESKFARKFEDMLQQV